MKRHPFSHLPSVLASLALGLGLWEWTAPNVLAHDDYNGCQSCHGDFRSTNSTKGTIFPKGKNHDMHRDAAYMATACNLCHIGSSYTPVFIGRSNGTAHNPGIGCTGCHEATGLRKHHLVSGVTDCLDCHENDAAPPKEGTKPPYHVTPDTKANNASNSVLATNINENWSVGDYLGLDNDGNNLYDLADYAVGPYRILSVAREGNHVRVTWLTAGGRTNQVQAAATLTGGYANVGAPVVIPGVGLVTNALVETNAAIHASRFYRLNATVP
jgi:hypothetical protein